MKHLTPRTIFASILLAVSGWLFLLSLITLKPLIVFMALVSVAMSVHAGMTELNELMEKNLNPVHPISAKELAEKLEPDVQHHRLTWEPSPTSPKRITSFSFYRGQIHKRFFFEGEYHSRRLSPGDTLEIKVDDREWESYRITN
jgi:hypothetical protein